EAERRAIGLFPSSAMSHAAGFVVERQIGRPSQLERHSPNFGETPFSSSARLVRGVQSPQDAEKVADGLERKRRKLFLGHGNRMLTRSPRARSLQRSDPMSGRKPRNQEPTHVGALLGTGPLASSGLVDRERWRRIVGDRVAARTRPGRLRDGTLTIHVASAVWAQELSLL